MSSKPTPNIWANIIKLSMVGIASPLIHLYMQEGVLNPKIFCISFTLKPLVCINLFMFFPVLIVSMVITFFTSLSISQEFSYVIIRFTDENSAASLFQSSLILIIVSGWGRTRTYGVSMSLIYSQVPSPLGHPSILYKYPWRDSNPQKTMDLNHVHMPILLQGQKNTTYRQL